MKLADDPDLIAGEYVLGTLEAGERRAAEEFAAREPSFAAAIIAWERRLAPLNELITPAEPPADMWPRIVEGLDRAVQPERTRQTAFMNKVAEISRVYGANVADLLVQSRRRWRVAAMLAFAVAIALGAVLVNQMVKPPPKPAGQAVAPARPAERLVGMLRYSSAAPAFLMTFDIGERTLTVRPVNVPAPADMRHELWLIPAEGESPVPLGRVAGTTVVRSDALSRLSRDQLRRASFAISLEPAAGPPGGKPSALVFSGKLEID